MLEQFKVFYTTVKRKNTQFNNKLASQNDKSIKIMLVQASVPRSTLLVLIYKYRGTYLNISSIV